MNVLSPIRTLCIAALAVALPLLGIFSSTTALAGQTHTVTVGSPDGLANPDAAPGYDGNFSLVARQDANGNVSGEWQDASTRNPGFHMKVTCLTVVGNTAWIGGVITQASDNTLIGNPTITEVVDNSKNGKGDTISFTLFCDTPGCTLGFSCTDQPALTQFEIISGNVVVK